MKAAAGNSPTGSRGQPLVQELAGRICRSLINQVASKKHAVKGPWAGAAVEFEEHATPGRLQC